MSWIECTDKNELIYNWSRTQGLTPSVVASQAHLKDQQVLDVEQLTSLLNEPF